MDYYDEIHSDEMHEKEVGRREPVIVTADEAKRLTDETVETLIEEAFYKVMGDINDAINSGKYGLFYTGDDCRVINNDTVINKLKILGYNVISSTLNGNIVSIRIKWG